MEDKFDYNSFAFRNTTVDKFYKAAQKMQEDKKPNPNSPKRQTTQEGAMGTVFKTKKPEVKA